MGYYVNPADQSKEMWLEDNAREFPNAVSAEAEAAPEERVICLVDNGMFTAAGICYSHNELLAFDSPCGRPKRWFVAPVEKLKEVCPPNTPF